MANKMRLVDANALYERLAFKRTVGSSNIYAGLESAIAQLRKAPTVDAVEVVHGRWEDGYAVDNQGNIVYKSIDCSNCHEIFKTDDREYWKERFKVCPFCGALMDGGNEDV